MEFLKISRQELHAQIWKTSIKEICDLYDIDEDGLEEICRRLNVPFPEKSYWKKLSEGKMVKALPLPDKIFGIYNVTLYKKDDVANGLEHRQRIKSILDQVNPGTPPPVDYSLDKLILSTKEGINKDWEQRHAFREKSKLLALFVSPEMLPRALNIMDLLIKGLRFKGHQLFVEQHQTFVVIAGEKIQISLGEKNRRVEFTDNYGHASRGLQPTGVLYFKKEGSSMSSKEWKDGIKKGNLEQQVFSILNELDEIAREEKEERERWRIRQEERAKEEAIKREHEQRQKRELAQFKELLFESHRFALSTQIRNYINQVESKAVEHDNLSETVKSWIAWAKKSADWYDPTVAKEKDELLAGLDMENLRVQNDFNYYHEQRERNFWKPWWSK